jgi:hypothetical protein
MKKILFVSLNLLSIISFAQPLLWAKTMGGTGTDYGQAMTIDSLGNIYSAGFFTGTVDFDPSPAGVYNLTSSGNKDIFVLKLNAAGELLWCRKMGGTYDDEALSIAVDKAGNIYTTGDFKGLADFDPDSTKTYNLATAVIENIFISKLNADGNFVWAKSIGAGGRDVGYSIAIDPAENICVTGFFSTTVDFDPSNSGTYNLTSAGIRDCFITVLDSSGNFRWAKKVGGTNDDMAFALAINKSGDVFITGIFQNTVDFDPGTGTFNITTYGNSDVFILKLDSGGNFIWVQRLGGGGSDYVNAIALDSSGNIYTTGFFYYAMDFDPDAGTFNLTPKGYPDIFISKLNSSGNFIWAKSMGGAGADARGASIEVDDSGNVYTVGYYSGTVDFDPGTGIYNLGSNGSFDIFISKLNDTGAFVWLKKIGGTYGEEGLSILLDSQRSIFVSGYFWNVLDFDPGTGVNNHTSAGDADIYILKLGNCSPPSAAGSITGASSVCGGSTSVYSISSVSGATGYYWSVPNGSIINSGQNSTSINVTFGTNSGSVNVIPINLCNGGTSASISVTVNPVITVIPSNPHFCRGDSVSITASGAGSFSWSPSTGLNTTTGATVIAKPSVTTTYTITGTNGSCTNTKTITVTPDSLPTITVSPTAPSVCEGNSVSITAGGANSYSWSPSTGLSSTSGATVSANPSITTTYTITGTNSSGCSNTKTITVTVNALPPVSISPAAPSYCKGGSVSITAIGANTYLWSPSTGLNAVNTATVIANPSVTTTYTVTGTGAFGCKNTKTVVVTVNPLPAANAGSAKMICKGQAIAIGATPVVGNTYSWSSSPNGFTSSLANPIVAPSVNTVYYLTETNTSTGCTKNDSVLITVKPLPDITTTINSNTISANQAGASYQWLKCPAYSIIAGATNQGYTPTANGDYAVIVTSNGCSDTSACVTVSKIGIEEKKINEKSITIYPNPNKGTFMIQSAAEETYIIVNQLGQTIEFVDLNMKNNYTTEVKNLKSGIYFMVPLDGNNSIARKIVVVK